MSDLATRHCRACSGDTPKLKPEETTWLLAQVPGWALVEDGAAISRTFAFKDYFHTMAFVNAVAWVAHTEDHHPDLSVHWGKVVVRYSTHAIGGLSENDFVCAAKVSALLDGPADVGAKAAARG